MQCYGIQKGDIVILALYDGDRLSEVQYTSYDEDVVRFETKQIYENAKVMVWKNFSAIKPICKYEKVYVY